MTTREAKIRSVVVDLMMTVFSLPLIIAHSFLTDRTNHQIIEFEIEWEMKLCGGGQLASDDVQGSHWAADGSIKQSITCHPPAQIPSESTHSWEVNWWVKDLFLFRMYIYAECARHSLVRYSGLSRCVVIFIRMKKHDFDLFAHFSFNIIHVGYSLTLPRSPSYRFVVPHTYIAIKWKWWRENGSKNHARVVEFHSSSNPRLESIKTSELRAEERRRVMRRSAETHSSRKTNLFTDKTNFALCCVFFVCLPSYDVYTTVSARRRKNIDTKYKSFWFLMLPHDSLSSCACQSIVAPKFALFIIEFNY